MRGQNPFLVAVLLCGVLATGISEAQTPTLEWSRLPDLPDTTGFAGAFAGVSGGALIVAGGTNFAAATPGGKLEKTWYDSVYVLESPSGAWQTGYKLPRALAYGVSIVAKDALICVGGCDEEKNHADVFALRWVDHELQINELPPLPEPVSCASGALVGDTIYIAGGQPGPNPLSGPSMRNFWSMDLAEERPRWRELTPWPGVERFYAVAATDGKSFYLLSGLRRIVREDGQPSLEYLRDAYRYDAPDAMGQGGWQRIADLPRPNAAAASPAPVVMEHILLLGNGADGSNLDIPASERPGFGDELLAYSIREDHWRKIGTIPAGRAALTAVQWGNRWVLPTGEVRPMVRSPEIHAAVALRRANMTR